MDNPKTTKHQRQTNSIVMQTHTQNYGTWITNRNLATKVTTRTEPKKTSIMAHSQPKHVYNKEKWLVRQGKQSESTTNKS